MMKLSTRQQFAPRISRKVWQGHIESQIQCKQSVDAYCQQHSLSVSRFHYWKNKLRKERDYSPFVPVIINPQKPEIQSDEHVPSTAAMPHRFCSIEFGQSRVVVESQEALRYVMNIIERRI